MLSRLMTRREQLILAGLAFAIALGSLALIMRSRHEDRPLYEPDEIQREAVPANKEAAEDEQRSENPGDNQSALDPAASASASVGMEISDAARQDAGGAQAVPGMTIYVRGAVKRPGVYTAERGWRLQELLDAAGGATEDANLTDINLAAELIDGSTLTIPYGRRAEVEQGKLTVRGGQAASALNLPHYTVSGWRPAAPVLITNVRAPQPPASAAPSATEGTTGRLDLNTATQAQLESLPGIGPVLATEIMNYRQLRPYTSVEDLNDVSGIGEKRLEAIRHLVTVN
ncbi:MAG: helix-hairpin-helix domain-containing protein [Candidatus Hydrogenedentes bacterium]|nr:helix-hairpin-helix domain-containing protein [Candidatus Hydrogenedentota bacterium]